MCPTGRLSSVGTLARPGEPVCARLLSKHRIAMRIRGCTGEAIWFPPWGNRAKPVIGA